MCWTLPKENRYPTATKTRDLKSAILADRKGIADKGRLTDKVINTLQNHVGMTIRQNSNNLLEIRNVIIATLHHCTAFKSADSGHLYGTKGKDS